MECRQNSVKSVYIVYYGIIVYYINTFFSAIKINKCRWCQWMTVVIKNIDTK